MADLRSDFPVISSFLARHGLNESPGSGGAAARLVPKILCLAILFVLAFGRYYVGFDSSLHFPVHGEPYSIARSLQEEGQFANPFAPLKTGPSAHLAPALPFVMATVMRVFGTGAIGWYVWNLVGAAVIALLIIALPLVSERLGMGFRTGVLAGLLWLAARPTVPAGWEGHWTALLAAVSMLVIGGSGWRRAVPAALLAGLLCGMALLTSPPASVPMFAGSLLLAARQPTRSAFFRTALCIGIVPVLMSLPWIARNYAVFGSFIPVRDNFGLELAVSYNDCAAFGIRQGEQAGCTQRQHPNVSMDEALQVVRMGEAGYNRMRLRQALGWIGANPGRALKLCSQRAFGFWFPSDTGRPLDELLKPGRRAQYALIYGLTLLSLWGLVELARRNRLSAALFGIWLVLFPPVYYVIQFEDRYRMPVLWMTFLLGAFAVTSLSARMIRAVSGSETGRPFPRA